MSNVTIIPIANLWREQIAELQIFLKAAKSDLIEAETKLAEHLAAINAFEFQLRAQLGRLIQKLDALTAEIKASQRQLHRRSAQENEPDGQWSAEELGDIYHNTATGNYRYRTTPLKTAQKELNQEQTAVLKQLYRQLARRFHPDMGKNKEDRAYRTQMMMAINAAYAAGDLAKLRQLAEKETPLFDAPRTDREHAEKLGRELERIRRRLAEIETELFQLTHRPSARLMRQVEDATANGRQWLAEIAAELEEQISMKMVERDVLAHEAAQQETKRTASSKFQSEAFADAIWDISLEHSFDASPDLDAEEWAGRRQSRIRWDESKS